GDPLLINRQLLDGLGLEVVEDLARVFVAQLIDERRMGGRLGELYHCGLENGLASHYGHGWFLLRAMVDYVDVAWRCSSQPSWAVPAKSADPPWVSASGSTTWSYSSSLTPFSKAACLSVRSWSIA